MGSLTGIQTIEMIFQLVIALVGLSLTYIYVRTQKRMRLWSDMGVAEDPGTFPLGSQPNRDMFMQKISFSELFDKSYYKFKRNKVWGYYGIMGQPTLVVSDMQIFKDIMIKDFDSFPSQRDFFVGNNKYLQDMMFFLDDMERWKKVRTLASPVFTTGKLKGMVPLMDSVCDALVRHLEPLATQGVELECKELFTKYSVDVVATVGFGLDIKSLDDPNSMFIDQVNKLLYKGKYEGAGGFLQGLTAALNFIYPPICKLLKLDIFNPEATNFFIQIVKAQLAERKRTGLKRNDFIDAMAKGFLQGDIEGEDGEKIFKDEADLERAIVANILILFIGGFDTSSTMASATCWFLVKNPEVQEALYEEVKEAIEGNRMSQHLDYDTIKDLEYLEGVIMETLRLYPLGNLERRCAREYRVSGTNAVVKPGTMVQIPGYNMMRDPEYFDNPLDFDPTRWSRERQANQSPYLLMTFGHGPRTCIGKRFANLQNKMALARLIYNYRLEPTSKTPSTCVPDPVSFSFDVKGGAWVRCTKRET